MCAKATQNGSMLRVVEEVKWNGEEKKVYKNGKFTTEIIKKLTAQHGEINGRLC